MIPVINEAKLFFSVFLFKIVLKCNKSLLERKICCGRFKLWSPRL